MGIVTSWETPKLQLCARIRESGTHSDIMWRAWFRCSRWHTVDRLLFCVSIAVAASPGRVLDGLGVAVPSIPSACVSPFPNGLGFLKSVLRRCELRCQGVVRPWRSRSAANATSIKALFGRRGLSLQVVPPGRSWCGCNGGAHPVFVLSVCRVFCGSCFASGTTSTPGALRASRSCCGYELRRLIARALPPGLCRRVCV